MAEMTVRAIFQAGLVVRGEARLAFAEYLFSEGIDPDSAISEVKSGLSSTFFISFPGSKTDQQKLNLFVNTLADEINEVTFELTSEQLELFQKEELEELYEELYSAVFRKRGFGKNRRLKMTLCVGGAKKLRDFFAYSGLSTDALDAAIRGERELSLASSSHDSGFDL